MTAQPVSSHHLRRLCRGFSGLPIGMFLFALILITGAPLGTIEAAEPRISKQPRLIVKFKADGPQALRECAQTLVREGRAFESATADASSSLDTLLDRHRVEKLRALFRRADGRDFSAQRAELKERLVSKKRRGGPAVRSRPAASTLTDHDVPELAHVYAMTLAADVDAAEALRDYRADPHVEWVQIDHENALDDHDALSSIAPDDPYFATVGSWGQPYADLWGLHRVHAPEAWALSRGEGVIVAVVDTGLDYDHPDIAANVWINPGEDLDQNGRVDPSDWNGIDDDGNGFVDDLRGFDFGNSVDANGDGDYVDPGDVNDADPFDAVGHGTHVAGTIAAIENNAIGIVGVAPRVRLMPVQGFDDEANGLDSVLWRAVLYAAENGASVINTSWSCRGTCPHNPLGEEMTSLIRAMDVVIVTSAGNNKADVAYKSPENRRQVITVGSSGQDDQRSRTFTNYGYLLDLAAPGGDPETPGVFVGRANILSLRASASTTSEVLSVGEHYTRSSGTSMATPHVAGAVALLRSLEPSLDYEAIRSILRRESADLGPPGHDREMGAGRLDALALLTHALVQDVFVAITSPVPTEILRPQDGDIPILGSALGDDLVEYRLSYGVGNQPTEWYDFTGPMTESVEDDVLGIFPASTLEEGAYTIRSEATARDGSISVEFVLLSLERITPLRLSSEGPDASSPYVHDRQVIWHSRRDPDDLTIETDDQNLFATQIETHREWVVQAGPGDQTHGSLGTGIAAWLDDRIVSARGDIVACRLGDRESPCDPTWVADGPFRARSPVVVRNSVYWTTSDDEISGCRFAAVKHGSAASGCEPVSQGLESNRRVLLSTDSHRLAWWNLASPIGLAICRILPATGACKSETVIPEQIGANFPTASGSYAAWTTFGGELGDILWVCQENSRDGSCPRTRVLMRIFDDTPRLSGNRLVFESTLPDQESDIFLCEYDAVLRECPIQRLTAAATSQKSASIDGDWVAWEDDRDGRTQIFGVALPRLEIGPRHITQTGRRIAVPVLARRFEDSELVLELEPVGDETLDELGVKFRDRGQGIGQFIWVPNEDQIGAFDFVVTARTTSGLFTRAHLVIEVRPDFAGLWRDPERRSRKPVFEH